MRLLILLSLLCLSQVNAAVSVGEAAFDQGKRAYEGGKYARSLDLLSVAINRAQDATLRNRAYYFQGLVLFELGDYYSSYVSFRNVLLTADDRNREIYEKAIKNAVVIMDRLGMEDRVGKMLANLPSNFIPASVGGLTHYAIGVHEFENGNFDKAESNLKSVNPENTFYLKALFYLGVISTRKKDYKESIFYFEKILEMARGKREFFSQAELARLNLARSLYSAGEIEKSIETYSQFLSTSPHFLTVLLEASWPLLRVNDTTVSLGNLHTILSPFYRADMVGEGYILRSTILYQLCKYEEMRRTLAEFFSVYDPVVRAMQTEESHMAGGDAYYRAYTEKKGMNAAFMNFLNRDTGISKNLKILELLREERRNVARYSRNEQMRKMMQFIDEAQRALMTEIGNTIQKLHKRKLQELVEQREQANYLKVEIVTGEKEMIEGQKGLPPKRVVDVETTVAEGYHFWPFHGEYWDDELGAYVYTTESACVN